MNNNSQFNVFFYYYIHLNIEKNCGSEAILIKQLKDDSRHTAVMITDTKQERLSPCYIKYSNLHSQALWFPCRNGPWWIWLAERARTGSEKRRDRITSKYTKCTDTTNSPDPRLYSLPPLPFWQIHTERQSTR